MISLVLGHCPAQCVPRPRPGAPLPASPGVSFFQNSLGEEGGWDRLCLGEAAFSCGQDMVDSNRLAIKDIFPVLGFVSSGFG